jgi:hypothetical protein
MFSSSGLSCLRLRAGRASKSRLRGQFDNNPFIFLNRARFALVPRRRTCDANLSSFRSGEKKRGHRLASDYRDSCAASPRRTGPPPAVVSHDDANCGTLAARRCFFANFAERFVRTTSSALSVRRNKETLKQVARCPPRESSRVGVKRKWLISNIRTRAVNKAVKAAARAVSTRAARSPERVDSRAVAGSRNPASSSRSLDANLGRGCPSPARPIYPITVYSTTRAAN